MSSAILFQNARILDGHAETALADHHVLVEDGTVRKVSDRTAGVSNAAITLLDQARARPLAASLASLAQAATRPSP